ncbi:MAG: hypothetical protein GX879_11210 [Bacteroidales bacterium]|nr:hypothetical protein [Bacteroidales bacterium]
MIKYICFFFQRIINFTIISFLTIIVLIASCTPESICLSNQNAMQASFYSAYGKGLKDTILVNLSIIGLDMSDSIYSKENVQKMFLPLSFNSDSTAFLFENNTLKDTLWVAHQKELNYISRKCGYSFNFKIDTVWFSNTFIDSAFVDIRTVRYNENIENVKIFVY